MANPDAIECETCGQWCENENEPCPGRKEATPDDGPAKAYTFDARITVSHDDETSALIHLACLLDEMASDEGNGVRLGRISTVPVSA